MAPIQSLSLAQCEKRSATRIFLQSQFCTKPKPVALAPATSLAGKTALVTGASTGLGLLAARHLLSLDLSRLILAVRSPATKGERAAAELRAAFPAATVDVWELEMGDYDSVVGFARRVADEFGNSVAGGKKRLDMAILNAGVVGGDFVRNDKTGHCQVVQVNYLSTWLLAILLLPVLRDNSTTGGRPGRLTVVGSGGVFQARLPNRDKRPFLKSFDDPAVVPWNATERYFASKALGMLFFVRLLDYLPPADEVVVNIVDPGYCKGTALHREATGLLGAAISLSKTLTARSLADGAWTYVDAAVVKGKESHGCFVMDWEIRPFCYAVYEPEGPGLMDALFEETMAEFEFAGARAILQSLARK